MTLSDAKKRANKKWNDKNKERMTYIRRRFDSKNFILKIATEEDLKNGSSILTRAVLMLVNFEINKTVKNDPGDHLIIRKNTIISVFSDVYVSQMLAKLR